MRVFTHFVHSIARQKETNETIFRLWQRLTSHARGRRSPADTPAQRAFLQSRDMVSAYLRTDMFRDVALQALAAGFTSCKPSNNDERRHGRLRDLSHWFSSALVDYVHMSPSLAEADDWTFRLSPNRGTMLDFISTLTNTADKPSISKDLGKAGVDERADRLDEARRRVATMSDYPFGNCPRGEQIEVFSYGLHRLLRTPFTALKHLDLGQRADELGSIEDGAFVGRFDLRAQRLRMPPWRPNPTMTPDGDVIEVPGYTDHPRRRLA